MKWVKDDQYVEITQGRSTDLNESVWTVESSIELKNLPIEFRTQIPTSDKNGYDMLVKAITGWAEKNGYQQIQEVQPT